jgi:hypothetical protein
MDAYLVHKATAHIKILPQLLENEEGITTYPILNRIGCLTDV